MATITIKFKEMVRGEHLLQKERTRIGRISTNDIIIENLAVSRVHAEIIQEEGAFYLVDLKSSNGTFVNGVRTEKAPLRDGDAILIGKHTMIFEHDNALATSIASAPKSSQDPDTFLRSTMEWEIKTIMEQATTLSGAVPVSRDNWGCLHVRQGTLAHNRYLLKGEATIIGAEEHAEICLTTPNAPLLAAVIHRDEKGDYFLSPTEVGVLLNNHKQVKRQKLESGDFISIQNFIFEFRASS